MQKKLEFRTETDSLGPVEVPQDRYWGAQTQRAQNNFVISPYRIPRALLRALLLIKGACAKVNGELKLLEPSVVQAITQAAEEAQDGKFDGEFPLDVFQTGSGTSWNMNANEVLAGRANEILAGQRGGKSPVHPNDHVNKGQSSNDVIPTALNLSNRLEAEKTADALDLLSLGLKKKSEEFRGVMKIGRTHLQDAIPMTLGAEFSSWAHQMEKAAERVRSNFADLEELALGGTALGTGLGAHPFFAPKVTEEISRMTGVPFRVADNFYEAISARDAQVQLMGSLNTAAVALMKICNDLRLLSSGPRTGLGEISLPSLQPGSSIMPGKVNPVILEMVIQASAHIQGKAVSVSLAGQNGPLQLNIMMPLLGFETLSSLDLLRNAAVSLLEKCIEGITADKEHCEEQIERSLAMVTPLAQEIGYDKAAELAKKAWKEGKSVRQVAKEAGILSDKALDSVLDPRSML